MLNLFIPGAAAALAASLWLLQPEPLPELLIESITFNGKGCPNDDPNTVKIVISEDKTKFVIIYKDMELTNPPGPDVKNLSCQTAAKLQVPAGYQVALTAVTTRGYANLADKIEARVMSGSFFAGVPIGSSPQVELAGPHDDFFEFSDKIPADSLVWSACGTSAIFGLGTTLILNAGANPKGAAIVNLSSDAPSATTNWQFRKC